MKFNFTQTRIKTITKDLYSKVKEYNKKIYKKESILEAPAILTHTLSYLTKQDGLDIVTADKNKLGDCISAIFPHSNRISILQKEYYQILSTDSFWLPIIISHEIGHWVLHAPTYKKFRSQLDLFEVSKIGSNFEDIKDLDNPDIDLLDQQANLFARELLMPDENMQIVLHQAGYYPPVIYKEHHLNLMPFEEYNTRLAEKIHDILQVPIPWIAHRLTELGLLQNQAEKKAFSFSA